MTTNHEGALANEPSTLEVPDDLLDLLAGIEPDYETEPDVLLDMDAAERSLRRLAKARSDALAIMQIAEQQIAKIDEWRKSQMDPINRRITWHTQQLSNWHCAVLANDDRRKTISLPSGRLEARRKPGHVEVLDADEFTQWAEVNAPQLLRVSTSIDKAAVKQMACDDAGVPITPDGEPVPGVVSVTGETVFRIKVED